MTFEQIIGDLKKKIYAPVYFLHGDEPWFIDQVSDFIEEKVLSDSEKEFNQSILYGKDLDVPTMISYAKRYPMMSAYQVVVVKEAQELKGLLKKEEEGKNEREKKDLFLEYLQQPTPTTILVLCYKYKKLDKRTRFYKQMGKQTVLLETKSLYDNQLPAWIQQFVLGRGYRIEPKATMLLSEYLGNDLSRIANEIGKLTGLLKPGDEISSTMVEDNIGISKEYNVFELQKAITNRNFFKANQIINYFGANQKNNPMMLTVPLLHSYFVKIMTIHRLADRTKNSVASALGINPYYVQKYETAAKSYPENFVIRNLAFIREYDLRLKGIGNGNTSEAELMKELIYKILH